MPLIEVERMSKTGQVPEVRSFAGGPIAAGLMAMAAALPSAATAQSEDETSTILRLLSRATFGWTPADLTAASREGWKDYLESQLHPSSINDSALDSKLQPLSTVWMDPRSIYTQYQPTVARELIEAKILRAVFSRRQLLERMVDFWTDHFNIDIRKGECQWLKTIDDREVIRPNALGNFRDLLIASAKSPAMVTYLDNRLNLKQAPNENYARELLELHTLGQANAFTQQDVTEVARCFTGWSVDGSASSETRGQFVFQHFWHDQGAKTVLGHTIPPNGGMQDGLTVLEILADHPLTAQWVALKLGRYFFGAEPPASYLRQVQASFSHSRGDMRATLRTALSEANLTKANPLLMRPFHLFARSVRALQPKVTSTAAMQDYILNAGQLPFHWAPPNGYPLRPDYWTGNMTSRWSFGFGFAANQVSGIEVPLTLLAKANLSYNFVLQSINQSLFSGQMSDVLKTRLRFYAGLSQILLERTIRDLYGLAMASPEYQYC